jgi:CheY-like chemotaxis protein
MQLKAVGLNEVVNDAARMLRTLIGENIELKIKTGDDLGIVRVDPVQIHQVLLNLVINARDAMPNGGDLSIVTANVELDAHYPRTYTPVLPGSYVMFSVSDTGVGMDEETASHIFEPFFTTKEQGKGTGFGLSIVYGIVKQSGGYIWVYSEPNHGTTFKVYLPRIADEATNVVPITTYAVNNEGCATILVIEDEEALARMVCLVLENSGYVLLHADNGEDALKIAKNYGGKIDLLISDIILRGRMDGLELAKKLSTIRPDTRLLFMSGYSDALNRCGSEANTPLLEKPFTTAELRAKVREILEENAETQARVEPAQKPSLLRPILH